MLYYLYLYENPVYLPDIAEQATEWEQNEGDVFDDSLHTYNELYHCHVPKLADADVITYSPADDVVRLAKNAGQLRPYLEWTADTDLTTIDTLTL